MNCEESNKTNTNPVNLQNSSCKHVVSIRVKNSVEPDQMKPADLDL